MLTHHGVNTTFAQFFGQSEQISDSPRRDGFSSNLGDFDASSASDEQQPPSADFPSLSFFVLDEQPVLATPAADESTVVFLQQ